MGEQSTASLKLDARGARARSRLLFAGRVHGVLILVVPTLGLIASLILLRQMAPVQYAILFVMYVAGFLGMEVGLHRYFSHGAFKTSAPLTVFLAVLGQMGAQGSILYWAGQHRRHHAKSDSEGDPHSPRPLSPGLAGAIRGLAYGHVGWIFADDLMDSMRYTRDLMRDPLLMRLASFYYASIAVGLVVPAALGAALTGTWIGGLHGLLLGGLVRIFLVQHATFAVNSLTHTFGARPFDTGDRSANVAWLVPITLGAAWHNNHHAFPASAHVGFQWWQVDPSGAFIKLLAALGLVWDVRVARPYTRMPRGDPGGIHRNET